MANDIIDFKTEKFMFECREFLKTGNISDDLRSAIYNSTPAEMETFRNKLSVDNRKIFDIAISQIARITETDIIKFKQKVNMLCQNVLDTLETNNDAYSIPEIINRYRDTINPIKALFYDLQEIIFLYDGKPKNRHHMFLIELFKEEKYTDKFVVAIDKDIKRLDDCLLSINYLKSEYKITLNSSYANKVKELRVEMSQWRKLILRFPEWIKENNPEGLKKECTFDFVTRWFKKK
jgi:hypothetical protein